tara:strand:- start:1453 stop:2394 length:942 start_codon:yes stop_codon:yes gene_type:complete
MAVHTILSTENIREILNFYDIGALVNYKGIEQGIENTNYLIETSVNKFILTIYEKRVKIRDLPFYFDLLEYCQKHEINCPIPIRDKRNQRLQQFDKKYFSLFSFINGKCLNEWDDNICFQVGKVLGRFHKNNISFNKKKLNDFGLTSWETLFKKCQEQLNSIIPKSSEFIENEIKYIHNNWPSELPEGIVHADLFPDNILFIDRKISGILDFYFACVDYYIYDLAILINAWSFYNEKFEINFFKNLILGYQSERKLYKSEKKSLNICLRGASIRFLLTRANDYIFNKDHFINKDPVSYFKILRFHNSYSLKID